MSTTAVACDVQSAAWFVIATFPSAYLTGLFLALIGAASSLISIAASSARPALTPDHLLGRVVSVFRLFGVGAAGLGALTGGFLAREATLQVPMWCAAGALLIAALALQPWRGEQ